MAGSPPVGSLVVVILDDDENHLELMRAALDDAADQEEREVTTRCYTDPVRALAELTHGSETAIVCDYRLGAETALDWIADFVRADVGPVIIVTSSGDEQIATDLFRSGASDYVSKESVFRNGRPLLASIREGFRKRRLEKTNRELARELRHANHELEKRNLELHRSTECAHEFVADVAHDFRTPLSIIKEFASIITDGIAGPVTEQQIEHLRYVDSAVDDLAHMVDDFLDSARLRSGILAVHRHEVDAAEMCRHLLPGLQRRGAVQHVEVRLEAADDLPPVFADPRMAARVVTNLAVNGVKFSGSDTAVTIQLSRSESGGVRIDITDQGPGIGPDDIKTIFERFSRVDTREVRRIKGFGLGLSICAQLTTLCFGSLEVSSKPGDGSTFSLLLPPAEPRALISAFGDWAAANRPRVPLSGMRIRPADEDSRRAISDYTRSTDLVLPLAEDSLWILGPSADPDRWRERLLEAIVPLTEEGAPTRELELAGPWADADEAAQEILPHTSESARAA